MSARRSRRGQPVIALSLVLVTWVGVRSLVWTSAEGIEQAPRYAAKPRSLADQQPAPQPRTVESMNGPAVSPPLPGVGDHAPRYRFVPVAPPVWPDASQTGSIVPGQAPGLAPQATLPPVTPPTAASSTPRIAAGHQLLYLAALAQLPLPDFAGGGSMASPPAPQRARPADRRWSGDAWLLLRRGGNGFNLPGAGLPGANLPSGAYGASQMGAVIRFRLAPTSANRPSLYLRATSAVQAPRGEELAAGFSARPLARVPIAAMIEARATRTMTGTVIRPAAALVSELPPAELPLGIRGEAYVQGGYVGGRDATAFVDGQGRLERRLVAAGRWQLRAGAAAWGGAQKGAKRIDVGPTASVDVPLGPVNGRVAADWRFRIGGNAAPTSGPAITLSAGF